MNLMGLQGGQYCPLSPEQIQIIHKTSLKILEKTGITYENGLDDTIKLLEENGAEIDRGKKKSQNVTGIDHRTGGKNT